MLLASYPLRLSATELAAAGLRLCGVEVAHMGSSLRIPGLDIAITDACSGISQLDAFFLIACVAVMMMHRHTGWKLLHFAFVIPAVIAANTIRIILTVLLYRLFGEAVLETAWHVALGYVQIVLALVIFLAVGGLFRAENRSVAVEGR